MLVKHGVPFSVAFGGDPPDALIQAEVIAYSIILGELDGKEFDWAIRQWKEPPQ